LERGLAERRDSSRRAKDTSVKMPKERSTTAVNMGRALGALEICGNGGTKRCQWVADECSHLTKLKNSYKRKKKNIVKIIRIK
jgi:hypothetical protein